ncbi:MAG: right-handed parallel beta-helix repeat-containing protein, partial [Methanobrevibacter sp.]
MFILILFLFISLWGAASAADTSIDELTTNADGGDVGELTLLQSGVDDTLQATDDNEILTATHTPAGSTIKDIQDLFSSGVVQPGDTVYLGNTTYTSGDWQSWQHNVVNVNVDNIIISGGNNDDSFSTLNGGGCCIFQLTGSGITLTNINFVNTGHNGDKGSAVNIQNSDCRITNCNFNNCVSTDGGAIYTSTSASNTVIDNCNFTNNQAEYNNGYGGAIYLGSDSEITNCNFNGNTAQMYGAIYSTGTTKIENCDFTGHHGSASAVYITGTAEVKNSNFTDNTASNSNGGALYIGGSNSLVDGCNFIDNAVTANHLIGGAIALTGSNSEITNSNFDGNKAGAGGAVSNSGSNNKIENCNFTGNTATDSNPGHGGGAIFSSGTGLAIEDCDFKSNTATTGSAIYVNGNGDATVIDSNFHVAPDLDVNNAYPSLTATLSADYSNLVYGNVEGVSGGSTTPLVNEDVTLEIYDSNGNLVVNVTDATDENGQITYDYSHLPHDVYTYKVYYQDGDTLVQKEGTIKMAEVEGTGFSSIQRAIDAASPGDVIFLKGITYENDFNHQMVIDKPITIIGTDGTVLDAEGESRIFNVNNGISGVNLANIEFINGYTNGVENDNGGAIRFGNGCNNIRITNSSFRDNRALYGMDQPGDTEKGNGAGIFFAVGCHDVEIANCNFENGSSYNGGGIFIDDNGHDFIIDNCNFTDNHVDNRTTGDESWGDADGHGGGIYISPDANRGIVSNCNFINNTATVSGGAIDNYKGNDWAVFNSTFTNNSVTINDQRPADIDHGAGAIWCCNSIMNITNSTFENNEAAYGGALRGAFNVYNSSFENNTALNGNGGAMDVAVDAVIAMTLNLEFINSTFYNNDAKGNRSDERAQGGAIHIYDIFSVNMTNCSCINNTADRGGAVDFYQMDYTHVENCTFDNNNATHEGGGLAIFCDHSTFKDTEVSNNNAGTDGGAIWNIGHNSLFDNVTSIDNTATRGGSAYVEGDNTTVQNSTFDGNSAENGGGFYVVGDDCNLINVEVSNNEATDYGGAIYISGNNATLDNVTSKENTASNGGSTYISGNDAVVKNSIFDNNEAYEAGAGIYIEGDDSKVNNNSFSYNEAFFGAGVFVSGENANFTTNNISHNNGFIGAGISVEGDHALFVDNNITYNDASYGAGGVFVQGSNANFTHNNISSNHAEENGGGIWCAGENLYLDEIYAFNNTAENGGFGVISQANNLIVKNSSFISNHADGDIGRNRGEGGAFHIYDSYNADIEGNFYNNTATNGSAIYVQDSTLKVHDSNFFDNQARSWQLNITPKPNTQFDQSESIEISVSHQGGDNIANAIHNRDGESDVQVKNITYPFYTVDGQVINKTTPNRYVTPVGSPDAEDIYLYDFENNQVITLVLYSGKGNFTYNGTTGEYDYNGKGKEINRFTYIVHPLYEIENHGNEIIVTQCGNEKTYTYDENTGKYIFNDSGKVSTCTYEYVGDEVFQYHFNESGKETTVDHNESSNKYTFHLTNGRVTEFYYNKTTGEYIFNDAGKIRKYYSINKTDIYGTIDLPLSKIIGTLDVGNYTVLALYKESTYYTEIYNHTNFEVISPLKKLTVNQTVILGDNVDFTIIVNNSLKNITVNNVTYENGTTLHNVTVTEIFNTAELEYINHTNSNKWVLNSTSTFNQTVNNKTVNYTAMVFKYQGNLSFGESSSFNITFKTLMTGTLINTVNLTTNETGNKTFTAKNKTFVYRLLEKLTVNETVNLGENVDFIVVVNNPENSTFGNKTNGTNGTTLHNITIYEIFKTSELQYVNHTNKDKWVINSTS